VSAAPSGIPLPRLEVDTEFFWTGGARGELLIQRCQDCGTYLHPPSYHCRACGSSKVAPEPVSGRGQVFSYTINRQPFLAAYPPPYVIAIVELEEQEGLQFTTRVVDCDPDDVRIGMPVSVRFEDHGDVFLPVFAPIEPGAAE
jgi:uncharacterized OB-fold protein